MYFNWKIQLLLSFQYLIVDWMDIFSTIEMKSLSEKVYSW